MPTTMNLSEAHAFVATLAPNTEFTLNDEPFEVMSRDCGVVEFARPHQKDITGAYHRASVENLAIALTTQGAAP